MSDVDCDSIQSHDCNDDEDSSKMVPDKLVRIFISLIFYR